MAGSALSGADLRDCGHQAGGGCSWIHEVEMRLVVSIDGL